MMIDGQSFDVESLLAFNVALWCSIVPLVSRTQTNKQEAN